MENQSSDSQSIEIIFRLLDNPSLIDALREMSPELFNETFFAWLRKLIQDAREQDDIRAAENLNALSALIRFLMGKKGIAPQDDRIIRGGEVRATVIGSCVTTRPIIAGSLSIGSPRIDSAIREWWHQILGHYDRYPLYAMMLALPADKEATRYLKEFGKELHLISGRTCLVITLTSLGLIQYGSDDDIMPLAVEEHVAEGYSLQVAKLFQITFDQFPCLLLFRDIRKPEHILVSLKGLDAKEISQEMRTLFSVVSEAIEQNRDPLTSIERYNKQQTFSERKKATWSSIQKIAGKTLGTMVEVFVEASIK